MQKVDYKVHTIPVYEVNGAFFRLFDSSGDLAEPSDEQMKFLWDYAEERKPSLPGEPVYRTSVSRPYAVTVNDDRSLTVFEMD